MVGHSDHGCRGSGGNMTILFAEVKLDTKQIPDELYEALLREFLAQCGQGVYLRWHITAEKGYQNESKNG